MNHRLPAALGVPLAGVLAMGALAGSASAATTQTLSCRASVVRADVLSGGAVIEPFVAGASSGACTPASAGLSSAQPLNLAGLTTALGGAPSVGPAGATTTSLATDSTRAAAAQVSVSGVSVPTAAGTISVVGPVQSTASYECVHGTVQAAQSSTLGVLQVGSRQIALSSPGASDTIPLMVGPTQIGSVSVNQNASTQSSNTETLLDVHVAGAADVVVGEAAVAQPASGACAGLSDGGDPVIPGPVAGDPVMGSPSLNASGVGAGPGSTSGAGSSPVSGASGASAANGCPLGTVGAGGSCMLQVGSQRIFVTTVGSGDITGARVISLSLARRRYHSACLRGAGPRFVVVGTNRRNRIAVKNRRMRVLGLGGNDTITVRGGAGTCVDGGAGRDTITALGRGRVSLYGGAGNDRIRVGNRPADVSGGSGNDVIHAGRGRDLIDAGTGTNTVVASGAHVRVRAGHGRTVARLRAANVAYARHHGVTRIQVMR